jgi:serine/threonine protein kinase
MPWNRDIFACPPPYSFHSHASPNCHPFLAAARKDLKPQNVLVASDESVRVCDLGLAWRASCGNVKSNEGTAMYMPPEAFDEDDETLDHNYGQC